MKANVPEKIYVPQNSTLLTGIEDFWVEHKVFGDEIEYTRTEEFIERACKWLRSNSHNYANNALGKEYLVNDFKDYMKGE